MGGFIVHGLLSHALAAFSRLSSWTECAEFPRQGALSTAEISAEAADDM
jgi:hypothetical protein